MFNLRKLATLRRGSILGLSTKRCANLILIHIDPLQPILLHEDQIELSDFRRSGSDILANFLNNKISLEVDS